MLDARFKTFAGKVRNRIVESGKTQKEIAEATGISQSRVSAILRCRSDIRFSTMVRLADALGCEIEFNLTEKCQEEKSE